MRVVILMSMLNVRVQVPLRHIAAPAQLLLRNVRVHANQVGGSPQVSFVQTHEDPASYYPFYPLYTLVAAFSELILSGKMAYIQYMVKVPGSNREARERIQINKIDFR